MINIAVVEENWFNLLEAIDDGEYDDPEQEEDADYLVCDNCGMAPCECDRIADETWDTLIEHALYVRGGN